MNVAEQVNIFTTPYCLLSQKLVSLLSSIAQITFAHCAQGVMSCAVYFS